MEKDFEGKTVIITGASAGLGRAIVREFAKQGANIGLIARGIEGLNAAKKEVEEYGSKALIVPTDVANADAVEEAAQKIEEYFGKIDVWINNAMVSVFGPFKKLKAKEYKRVTDVTYHGQVYGTMSALKRMIPHNQGTIILIGSALAYRGIPLQSAYCGAKHAIHGFFESLRTELIKDKSNIKLSMVQMPAMNTTQFGFVKTYLRNEPKPMGKIYEPELAAKAVVEVAKKNQREVYVGYSTIKTVVGNKIASRFLDHYLANTGYKGQQTDKPVSPNRKNNLYKPLPGDHGARGNFADSSTDHSIETWLATNRKATLGMIAAVTAAICTLFFLNNK